MDRYEIRLAATLDARRARSLGCTLADKGPADGSRLLFIARDQAELYGLLARLRDMGAELVGVRRVTPAPGQTRPTGAED